MPVTDGPGLYYYYGDAMTGETYVECVTMEEMSLFIIPRSGAKVVTDLSVTSAPQPGTIQAPPLPTGDTQPSTQPPIAQNDTTGLVSQMEQLT